MPRRPMVRRHIVTTVVKAMCVDVAEKKLIEKTFSLPRTYKTESKLIKKLREVYDDANFKIVSVISYTVETRKYAMDEEVYIKYANEEE